MRPVQLADIEVAMRVLLAHPPAARVDLMAALIADADTADRYRKRTGKRHAVFGSGTLLAATASYRQAGRPAAIGADALDSLGIIIAGLADRRNDHDL